jgi:hypothetical protein
MKKLIKLLLPNSLYPSNFITKYIEKATQQKVVAGPFEGMKYINKSHGSCYLPKLLGTYEKDLYPIIDKHIVQKCDIVIDIGAAEGYYAIGLAKMPSIEKVIAFEAVESSREMLKEMAVLNEVMDKLVINGSCHPNLLSDVLHQYHAKNIFLIIDVEGYERILLDPVSNPLLKGLPILLEIHDYIYSDISAIIKSRFENSHYIQVIHETKREKSDYTITIPAIISRVFNKWLIWAIREHRPVNMYWFLMIPRKV